MYERFTDRARKVMQLANQEAQRFNHEYIGTEHILLGLVAEGSGVGANVLKNLDIDLRKARKEVEKVVQVGPADEPVMIGRLPHTPQAKFALQHASEESRLLNHNYVGTEHLLLGLLREGEGVAAQVLTNLGLKLEDVRQEVLNLLGHNTPAPAVGPMHVVVDALAAARNEPTAVQLRLVRERVRSLNERKEAFVAEQDFVLAAKCRDEADALAALLAWYETTR